jgi:NAD(P)-dependent dehydrogenase (short-subunit alcohol dehydrogenase family)
LSAAVERITGLPMEERMQESRDLGETMVIAHAVAFAEDGADVTVLIDDSEGARTATLEMRRLERLRQKGRAVGSLILIGTLTVLEHAAGGKDLPDRAMMRSVYERLREHDDGLLPIENTRLLLPELWKEP